MNELIPVRRGQRLRVLHVFKHITGGGVESWLLQVMRHMDRDRFQMDVAVRDDNPNRFDVQFEQLGARTFHFARPACRLTYAKPLREILTAAAPYDIVHCHSVFNRGFVLRLARQYGVPVRIAHSHNAPTTDGSAIRKLRVAIRARVLSRLWTAGIACSLPAGHELFCRGWRDDPRVHLLYCGVDLDPFHSAPDPAVRAELGIPSNASVVGHVGRFNEQKNHAFLIRIAEQALSRDPNIWFLLIGGGELRDEIEADVRKRGIAGRFVFLERRDDVPRLMLSAMDAFLLPSFHEGLPLVGMEAQAAGLPMLISDSITPEMDAAPALVRRMSLRQSAAEWAETLLNMLHASPSLSRSEALATMAASPFNIRNSVASLQVLYEGCASELPHTLAE